MPDIEDSLGPTLGIDRTQYAVKLKSKRKNGETSNLEDKPDSSSECKKNGHCDSVLPWNRTIYLKTWGCSHNNSDTEYMAGLLANEGFKLTSNKTIADLWLLNSCTVKTPSETQLENLVKEGKSLNKFLVVAGCVSQAEPNVEWLRDVSLIGTHQIANTVNVINDTLNGFTVRFLSRRRTDVGHRLDLPKIRRNNFIEILAINSGCLNKCTYCKTKMARGDLLSYPIEDLLERVRSSFENDGVKELWLTSEDVGAWGRDIGLTIVDLLQALVDLIPDGCKMRIGMTNPPYILDHLEEIAKILSHPKVYKFLHIPIQSGSNAVLNDMKREYSREQFCMIVDYLVKRIPNIYIATDFICAFPTENEEDFEESLTLIKKYKFPSLFINQFYPRSGTPAARLKKITSNEARRRTAEMTQLFHSYNRYTENRIGEVWDVLICEIASDQISYVGHNEYYEHILVKPSKSDKHFSLLGRTLRVKITGVSKFYMRSEIIGSNIFSISSNLTWTLITIVAAFVLYVFLLNFTFDS